MALGDFAFFRRKLTGGPLVSGFGGAINLISRTLPSLPAVSTPLAADFSTNWAVAHGATAGISSTQ